MSKCPECGSDKVFPGRHFNVLSGISPQYFRPRGLKAITAGRADVRIVPTTFCACAQCGLLWSRIDPLKLQEVLLESGGKTVRERLG
jgi:hypothetical protein